MEGVEDILIVGAGIAGLSTALGLHRMGLRSLVLESANQLRVTGYSFMAWMNAWKAFDALGVGDKLRQHHMQLDKTLAYTTVNGVSITTQLSLKTSGKNGTHEARCVRRKLVVEALAEELPRGNIRYNSRVVAIEQAGHIKMVHLADGTILKTKILIGSDGVNSVVAKWLDLPAPVAAGRVATRGLVEYPHCHHFKPEFLQYFGNGFRCGFLPIDKKSIYWFFTCSPNPDLEKIIQASPSKAKQFVMTKLADVPEEVREIVERTETDIVFSASLRLRLPWDLVRKRVCQGNVCVVGDALHPMTPDLAQGACSALEDGITLARCLGEALLGKPKGRAKEGGEEEEEYNRVRKSLEKFANERKWRLFNLTTTAYLMGLIQQSSGTVLNFLRDRFLSRFLFDLYLMWSDFDCGKLYSL